ncbi:MAG: 2OG-Fe(II) oxygenase [Myxococcota bacterium]
MHEVMKTDGFIVYDDALSEDAWSHAWTYFQFEELLPVTTTEGAWKLEDGHPLAGPEFHSPPRKDGYPSPEGTYPTETGIDPFIERLVEIQDSLSPWIGDDWFRLSGRPYIYPTGSALTWHRDDHEFYSGAFIYYAHPEWNAQWGGELLIADMTDLEELPVMPFRFDNRDYSEMLMERGVGRYVMPKPNRLIVLGDSAHAVTPVTRAAGRHVRASLAGFFLRKDPEG